MQVTKFVTQNATYTFRRLELKQSQPETSVAQEVIFKDWFMNME